MPAACDMHPCVARGRVGRLSALREERGRETAAPVCALRLVHEYQSLDDVNVRVAIGTMSTLYPGFIEAVDAFLARAGC